MTDTTARDLIQRLADALQWFIDEDDTNRGDFSADGGVNWEEENAYWIAGLEQGIAAADEARAYLAAPDEPAVPSDAELLELMPEIMRDEFAACANTYSTATGGVVKPGVFRTVLNTVALEYARAIVTAYGSR